VITLPELLQSFCPNSSAAPYPEFQELELKETPPVQSLVDLHAHFLKEYQPKDRIGIHHHQWQMLAGAGPKAACSSEARQVASAYSKSLDVEKGKPCPKEMKRYFKHPKWDFMNNGDPDYQSPTATGECYRQAARALEQFQAAKGRVPRNKEADNHLTKAWEMLS